MKFYIDIFNLLLLLINPFLGIYALILNKKKYVGIVLILIGTLISLSKTNVNMLGDDIFHYANTFLHLDSFFNVLQISLRYSRSVDPLFWYPVYFISLLTKEVNIFLFFCYFSTLSILYTAYYKVIGKDAIFVFVLFLSTTTFYYIYGNTLRQAFVISLSVWFLYFLTVKENRKALILSVVSVFFHPTGLFLILVYFISKIRIKFIYIFLLVSFTLQFLPILSLFGTITDSIGLQNMTDKALVYAQREGSTSFLSLSTLLFIFIFSLYLLVKKNIDDFRIDMFIKIYLIYQSFYMIFISNQTIAIRLFSFRGILDVLLLVILISYFKQKRLLKITIIILFLSLNYLNLVGGANKYLYDNKYNLIFLSLPDLLNLVNEKLKKL